jgi:hypothetical protein
MFGVELAVCLSVVQNVNSSTLSDYPPAGDSKCLQNAGNQIPYSSLNTVVSQKAGIRVA